jgi:hypothetical protein
MSTNPSPTAIKGAATARLYTQGETNVSSKAIGLAALAGSHSVGRIRIDGPCDLKDINQNPRSVG